MNNDLLKYLQQDNIGKVIAKGLADVYTHKPQTPVKYLADWLKKYSNNQKEIAKLQKDQKNKLEKQTQFALSLFFANQQATAIASKNNEISKELEVFQAKVKNDEYQEELLSQYFPEFLQNKLKLTGAYIGYINHPPKEIGEQQQQENAHLDTSIPKLINYIGSSKSQSALMLAKTLPQDKGVTASALSLSLDDPVPAQDGTVEVKDKYVYIPNVVKNQNVHYFRLPKLGSYIALPLIYQSYLTEHIFDVALEARLKYLAELQEFQKAKSDELKQIETQEQTLQQKLTEATQKNDEAAIETTKTDLDALHKRRKQREQQLFEEQKTELPTEKRQFLVCADTLGQDEQISADNRNTLVKLVKYFRDSWESKQHQLLYKDVNYQIRIKKNEEQTTEAIIEHLQKIIEISPENAALYNEIEDQKIREYKKSTWQLQTLKKELTQNQQYLASFFKLKNFRVVKFKSLIQYLLHFLGFKKTEIILPGKTQLDWKRVRATNLYADTFNSFLSYSPEGPKTNPYPFYCKISKISQHLQKFEELQVFKYNIGLGALLMFVKKLISHRIENIELRRHQKNKQRDQRSRLIEENDKITEEKKAALEKHKQSLAGEDLEAFNEEEWSAKYDQEFPLKQIPPEIVDDIDNDF